MTITITMTINVNIVIIIALPLKLLKMEKEKKRRQGQEERSEPVVLEYVREDSSDSSVRAGDKENGRETIKSILLIFCLSIYLILYLF